MTAPRFSDRRSPPQCEFYKVRFFSLCGICGIFNASFRPEESIEAIDRMSARLVHRGPDSQGKFERPGLALAVRRLSIIDLEHGDQPLSNEAGDVTVIFNGEIYNHRELRQRLRGHQLRTQSDGEVIAHLYEERQENFVDELNGMFAIALWDEARRQLVLARDRAGEKPLYYWRCGETLVFASEIKAILDYPGVSREIDRDAVLQYLFYGYVPAPRSIFAGIRKLPAGSRMIVDSAGARLEPYWQLKNFLRPRCAAAYRRPDEDGVVDELRRRLREAAVSRLVSDVPLGVFLSGGVDSSTLVALMSELAPGQVNTFSVSFSQKAFNEERYARLVARRFRTRHHVLETDEAALLEGLVSLAAKLDEPLADPAVVPTYLLSCFARRQIKVALSGEGSDELFGGYPTYLGARLAPHYMRLPGFVKRVLLSGTKALLPRSAGAVPAGFLLDRFLRYAGKPSALRHQTWFGIIAPEEVEILAPSGEPTSALESISKPLQAANANCENAVAEAMYLDFCLYLADDLLVKVDRASMACSLEVRTPFLDHRLIEFCAGLPSELKLPRFELKSLLKRAVEPWLPREIVSRRKRGFSVPIARWLRNELYPLADEMLSPGRIKAAGFFAPSQVRRLLEEHRSGKADHRKALWALLCFELWCEHWAK
ncbi:MAG: asparagine synthase (glutamine-hydrolyzing) [Terriglobia bacterium]